MLFMIPILRTRADEPAARKAAGYSELPNGGDATFRIKVNLFAQSPPDPSVEVSTMSGDGVPCNLFLIIKPEVKIDQIARKLARERYIDYDGVRASWHSLVCVCALAPFAHPRGVCRYALHNRRRLARHCTCAATAERWKS